MKFLNDSVWFCMEKLKKHGFETKIPKILQIIQKSQNIRNKIHFFARAMCAKTAPSAPECEI